MKKIIRSLILIGIIAAGFWLHGFLHFVEDIGTLR